MIYPKEHKKRICGGTSNVDRYWHYEYLYCTSRLGVYRCKETGHIETFQAKDFIIRSRKEKEPNKKQQPSKYARLKWRGDSEVEDDIRY